MTNRDNLRKKLEYTRTISITEWMAKIDPDSASLLRNEDNTKRNRLGILSKVISLPYDKPEGVSLYDVINHTSKFLSLIRLRGNKKYAFRLLPLKPHLPKLRTVDKTLKDCLRWLYEQDISPNEYRIEIIPQSDKAIYSSILLITDIGVWGQIAPGKMWQLSLGLTDKPPTTFAFDFKRLLLSKQQTQIRQIILKALNYLLVENVERRKKIQRKIKAKFTKEGYLKGYFEFVVRKEKGVSFIDYNRILFEILKSTKMGLGDTKTKYIRGVGASPGNAIGKVKIVQNPHLARLHKKEIIVCRTLTIEFIPLIKKAIAVISEQGGLLSHATIICRELHKPYIINAMGATQKLKNGDRIEIDATEGVIKKLNI